MTTTTTDVAQRQQAAAARLREAAVALKAELSGIDDERAQLGSQWSLNDTVRHMGLRLATPFEQMERLMRGDRPDLGPRARRPQHWANAQLRALEELEQTAAYAERLSPEQAASSGLRDGAPLAVIDLLEFLAHHAWEHIEQVREIKAREGL
ncbi:MAG: hypothetical protein HYY05_07045 [Chloroflexi bacterium]|nr:hypothetical protein [Chloroflexota bacterium]